MKTNLRLFCLTVAMIGTFVCVTSCRHSYLDDIDFSGVISESKNIAAPGNVSATQGSYRSITLRWTGDDNAKQYLIYSADSQFDEFKKVGETKGNLETFTYSVPAGKTAWFRVQAVSTSGEKSAFSEYVYGSSMAVPSISLSVNGTTATVAWWMNNCDETTYQDLVAYKVLCYEDEARTKVHDSIIVGGDTSEVEFNNLAYKNNYYFQIKAYTKDEAICEYSDLRDSKTECQTVPYPPENVVADRGIDKTQLKLSWTLPESVDYYVSSSNYDNRPLYFTIERKANDEKDYSVLVPYIGSVKTGAKLGARDIGFDCSGDSPSTTSPSLEITVPTDAIGMTNYAAYVPGARLTFTDTTVVRGKTYSYRIRSYTDDAGTKIISGESSAAICEGWLISVPSLEVATEYPPEEKESDCETFSSITVNFKLNFEDFGLDEEVFYKYILTRSRTSFSNRDSWTDESVEKSFSSVEEVNNYSIFFDSEKLEQDEGYYLYTIFICPESASDDVVPVENIFEKDSFDEIPITKDKSLLPVIEEFTVEDGYSNKYILRWKNIDDCKFIVKWSLYDSDLHEIPNSRDLFVVDEGDPNFSRDGDFIKYVDEGIHNGEGNAIVAGDRRKYSITAVKTLENTVEAESISKTLGMTEIRMSEPSYDSINLVWSKVQMVDTDSDCFKVRAYYKDDPSKNNLALYDGENPNTSIAYSTESGLFTCKIERPEGFDKASVSGKDIVVEVIASNSKDKTTSSAVVRTFGPALINASKNGSDANYIKIKWNAVDGASGYIINRVRFSTGVPSEENIGGEDNLFYDCTKNQLFKNGEAVKSSVASVAYDSNRKAFLLSDNNDDGDSFNQGKISMGYPYAYTILPVIGGDEDFTIESFKVSDRLGNPIYTDLKFVDEDSRNNDALVVNGAYGYGLNVAASKATAADSVTVTWDKPYMADSKKVKIFRRTAGSTDTFRYLKDVDDGSASFVDNLERNDTNAYEYAVCYNYTTQSFKASYLDSLKIMDESSLSEYRNKGYSLAISNNVSAKHNGGYTERFFWTAYDYNNRAVGPDYYEIQMCNYNNARGWVTVATVVPDVKNADYGQTAVQKDGLKNDSNVNLKSSSFCTADFEAVFTEEESRGLMQVLRDYKHYYRIRAVRNMGEGQAPIYAVADGNGAYAYREITPTELVKCVNLIFADALYQTGIQDGSTGFCYGKDGKFNSRHKGSSKTFRWGTDNADYKHIFRSGLPGKGEELISGFTVKMDNAESRSAADGNTLYYIPEGAITVSHECGLESYSGTVTATVGVPGHKGWTELSDGIKLEFVGKFTLNGKIIHEITNDGNKEDLLKWFPYLIGESQKNGITSYNEAITIYNSTWWSK